MKKLSIVLVVLFVFSLLLCSAAYADTLMPKRTEVHPDRLVKTASYARILGYNEAENTLTVELIAPEVFDYADVYALKAGDKIFANGMEVTIETLAWWDDWKEILWINDGDVCLIKDLDGDYRTENSNDHVWHVTARLECPVTEHLLLMDNVDEISGGMLELPRVFAADETIAKVQAEQAAEYNRLAINNVYVVFDGEGDLAVIHRFYVPWQ